MESLAWLRYSLNSGKKIPSVSDWNALMSFANKQNLTGICFPTQCPDNIEKDLLLQWIGNVQLIESQNKLMNIRVGQLFKMLEDAGFSCVLLKGQGNAGMYPSALLRCSGDIDVWVDADEEAVIQYVKNLFPDTEESFKHIHCPVFADVSVDVHISPLKFYSSHYNKKLQKWIERQKKEQFSNVRTISGIDKEICVPTVRFNAIYQLGHMYIHFFDEGIGFRHLVDYFYVLKGLNLTEEEREEIVGALRDIGMMRFAKAVMWIESNVLGLPVAHCIVKPDEKRGQQLLADVLDGGNFGKYSQRYKGRTGFYRRGIIEARRLLSLMGFAPYEATFCLLRKVKTVLKHIVGG